MFPQNRLAWRRGWNQGTEISAFYDPMIAKIITKGKSSGRHLAKLSKAQPDCRIAGIETNLDYLQQVLTEWVVRKGKITTKFLGTYKYHSNAIDVLKPGTQSTVQDYPGRLGYWAIGVPPSGPMDAAQRFGWRIGWWGMARGCGGAGIHGHGPDAAISLALATIVLTGAHMQATLDGNPLAYWKPVKVRAGSVLDFKSVQGAGVRSYLAIAGGLDVPDYLGSKATFTLGKFGGHAGRALRVGDVLRMKNGKSAIPGKSREGSVPRYSHEWKIGVLYGPHGAPGFFHAGRHRHIFSDGVEGALQFGSDGRAADWAAQGCGRKSTAARRNAASVEHSR